MKRISVVILLLMSVAICSQAQIYVDNQGNVYDQSKTTQQNRQKPTNAHSQQYKKQGFDKSKLEFGGSLGLQFGDYTGVHISPQVGYNFSNYLSAGAGIGYSYYGKDKYGVDIAEHFASFNLYGNIYPVKFIVLSVKPEISRMWQTTKYRGEKSTYTKFVPSVVVGGGLRFGPLMAQIKYDVVQDNYSPYGSGIFYSVGYTFDYNFLYLYNRILYNHILT